MAFPDEDQPKKKSKLKKRKQGEKPPIGVHIPGENEIIDAPTNKKYNAVTPIPRDITDELKGWMTILCILFRHFGFTHANSAAMRVFFTMFLFLHGFGHCCKYITTGNNSLARYFKVLVRLNLTPLLFCMVLQRPYYYYSWVGYITFWYSIIWFFFQSPPYIEFRGGKRRERYTNVECFHFVLKFVVLVSIAQNVPCVESFKAAKNFVPPPIWEFFLNDGGQFCHHFAFDKFSVVYGLLFAYFCHIFHFVYYFHLRNSTENTKEMTKLFKCIGTVIIYLNLYIWEPEGAKYHSIFIWGPATVYLLLRFFFKVVPDEIKIWAKALSKVSLEMFIVADYYIAPFDRSLEQVEGSYDLFYNSVHFTVLVGLVYMMSTFLFEFYTGLIASAMNMANRLAMWILEGLREEGIDLF